MHAQAGTIGYNLILDEEARQAAKQASRERTFGRASDLGIGHRVLGRSSDVIVVDDPTIGGTSTPSTAASPHDAEATREAARLEAAKHLEFLRVVRAWADGESGVFPLEEAAKAIETVARVRKVLDGLDHQARQYSHQEVETGFERPLTKGALAGTARGLWLAVEELRGALR